MKRRLIGIAGLVLSALFCIGISRFPATLPTVILSGVLGVAGLSLSVAGIAKSAGRIAGIAGVICFLFGCLMTFAVLHLTAGQRGD
jgi:hypothetical protein